MKRFPIFQLLSSIACYVTFKSKSALDSKLKPIFEKISQLNIYDWSISEKLLNLKIPEKFAYMVENQIMTEASQS